MDTGSMVHDATNTALTVREDQPIMTEEEAEAVQAILGKLNEAADGMIQSLERMHLLMEDIKSELRAAHGKQHATQEQKVAV